ncbi:MAG: hypothetical protein LUH05_00190 [Candidatus Gastranaerophilales bacterium]|nr:hypothetical protein [Candidatus Gastranaerophilales bacterium]
MSSDIFNNMQIQYTPNQKQSSSSVKEAEKNPSVTVKESIAAAPASSKNTAETDTVEISSNDKQKNGPVKKVKGFIANIKKFFASAGEYTKGAVKGIGSGAVAGSLIYTGGAIINHVKAKSAEKAGTVAKKLPNKFLAVAAAGIAIAGSLWNASLNATERSSNIDLRWQGLDNGKK